MSELKPCPFCGEEAVIYIWNGGECTPRCKQCRCQIDDFFDTKEEAIAAWNRRAERTCHLRKVIKSIDDYNGVTFHDELWDECSECGYQVPARPNYCPNCGAKVITDGA